MSIRVERVREKIKSEAARIITSELKDPRLGFVTVVGCDLTHDFRYAKIKVSILADKEADIRRVMRMLEDARGFIQRTIGSRLRTRVTPELSFVLDRTAEKSVKISSLLDDLRRERETREGAAKEGGDGDAPLSVSGDLASAEEADAVADDDDDDLADDDDDEDDLADNDDDDDDDDDDE